MPKPMSILFIFFISLLISSAHSSSLYAPISKDRSSRQYTISIYLQTPLQPTNLFLDLGGSLNWVDCTVNYTSTTYHHIPCETPLCVDPLDSGGLASGACFNTHDGPQAPGNTNNSCALIPENPVSKHTALEDANVDTLALPTTTDTNKLAVIPEFVFSCAKTALLNGFAKKATGLAGLSRSNFSLPAQVSRAYGSPHVFALCLPGSITATGVAIFNTSGPYFFTSGIDLALSLIYTPLLLNPVDFSLVGYYDRPSDEFFIGVTEVKVNGKPIQINQTILTIDDKGFGGTRISTAVPYTALAPSIFTTLTEAFVKESAAMNLTRTVPVKPFSVCYLASDVSSTRVGPAVPTIDLVMGSENVYWRIFGANSMVRITKKASDVWCLGFVDGGPKARSAIVIGGQQLEDNLLQFDVKSKRLGFSSSILTHGTSCGNYKFNGK